MSSNKPKSPFFQIPIIGSFLQKLSSSPKETIKEIISSPDNDALPRVSEAGNIEGNTIITHNGLRLSLKSVEGLRDILKANKGVAEPQHERAFAEVLRAMGPSPLILDVGARNGFYSMWMKQVRPGARCVVVEPNKRNLAQAQENFALNKLHAQFFNAYVSMSGGRKVGDVEVVSVEEISRRLRADYINLLHADIEGYELELLKGAVPVLKDRGVDYMIISTHTKELHAQCKALLEERRYVIIGDVLPEASYVEDGLLVARRAELKGLDVVPLSQKPLMEAAAT